MGERYTREKRERNCQKGVKYLLRKHTQRETQYELGLKYLLLGHRVDPKRFFHCRKFYTHKKQVNWRLDSKSH